ncbi:MAG: hypothetical protein HRT51_11565 [Colwellia sp.]|nr:hypothetical protein [Colwellia sp.]
MKIIKIFIFFFALCSGYVNANEAKSINDMLITAKIAGMCGAISQIVTFQETTKMPKGDEFVLRFLNTEAARLGKSVTEFLQDCVAASQKYGDLSRELDILAKE